MKIIFIGSRDIHLLGGIENYMFNLTRCLARMGHDCTVYCESDHNEVREENGVRLIYMRGPRSNLICKPWVGLKATLRTLLREKGVSLIHYNAWPPSLWSPLATIGGVPSLMMGHGLEWQRSKYSPLQQRVMKLMERITAHTNRHLLMCSQAQTDYFRERYGREAVTMPTAVNLPPAEAPASDILERFGIVPGRYFLFLARIVQDKNPDYLIRGFQAAAHEGFQLVIAGSNPADTQYVESLHALAAVCPQVIFTGAVYGADKDALFRSAYAFCLPSTIEGLSIGLLEAMSYRLPVIASDIAANREVLQDDTAVWVRPESDEDIRQAVEHCIAAPQELEAQREANFARVQAQYVWEKVARRYEAYIKTIAKK